MAYKISLEFGSEGWWLLEERSVMRYCLIKKFFYAHLIKLFLSLEETGTFFDHPNIRPKGRRLNWERGYTCIWFIAEFDFLPALLPLKVCKALGKMWYFTAYSVYAVLQQDPSPTWQYFMNMWMVKIVILLKVLSSWRGKNCWKLNFAIGCVLNDLRALRLSFEFWCRRHFHVHLFIKYSKCVLVFYRQRIFQIPNSSFFASSYQEKYSPAW